MSIIIILTIAVSLSMDAFSLSLAYGTLNLEKKYINRISIIVGTYHFFMPLIGLTIGDILLKIIPIPPNIIVCIVLTFIGIEMIIDSFKKEEDSNTKQTIFTYEADRCRCGFEMVLMITLQSENENDNGRIIESYLEFNRDTLEYLGESDKNANIEPNNENNSGDKKVITNSEINTNNSEVDNNENISNAQQSSNNSVTRNDSSEVTNGNNNQKEVLNETATNNIDNKKGNTVIDNFLAGGNIFEGITSNEKESNLDDSPHTADSMANGIVVAVVIGGVSLIGLIYIIMIMKKKKI